LEKACHLFAALMSLACCASVIEKKVGELESWGVGKLGSWGGIAITSLGKACHLFAALMSLACCASVIEKKVGKLGSWRVGEGRRMQIRNPKQIQMIQIQNMSTSHWLALRASLNQDGERRLARGKGRLGFNFGAGKKEVEIVEKVV
jgi:hypothetical protein